MTHQSKVDSQSQAAPISSFFSALQLRRLQRSQEPRRSSSAESHNGAFLFLDLVAFTQLGETLSEQGVKGAEDLSDILHAYYRPILATIKDHGGDVLFFAGDALGVVWLAEDEDKSEAAVRAAQCGLAIQEIIPTIQSGWSKPLAFRGSLGVGRINAFEVGGIKDNWMQLVRGEVIDLACQADAHSSGGALVLSKDSLQFLTDFEPKISNLATGFVRLDGIGKPIPPMPLPDISIDAEQEQSLKNCVTEAVHRHLYYPSSAVAAEFRKITVLFADISATDAETLQAAAQTAQKEVQQYEGVVYQLLEDDKGTGLIIVFGLPGASHADDHMRALLLAGQLSTAFNKLGVSPRLGISTGTAFCGPLGTEVRQQYSIIGSTVNLAARLMMLAGSGETYCDSQTRKLAGDDFEFEEAGWTAPKGFREPTQIFKPGKRINRDQTSTPNVELVGRDNELNLIEDQIVQSKSHGSSRLLVIEAEPGVGKSALLQAARDSVVAHALKPVIGSADAFETGTAYFAFRNIARHWCGIDGKDTAVQAQEKLHTAFNTAPDLVPLIPLIGPVIGFEFSETEQTENLRGQLRSENTRRVLLHLAQKSFKRAPSVLLLEDGHWMDGASWAFLDYLMDHGPAMLVLLTTRPLNDTVGETAKVLASESTKKIELLPISRSSTEEMIRQQLGVSEVAADALDLVHDRAEGNPLFVREIVRNLMEAGNIKIRNSRVQLLKRQSDAEPVPDTLNGVITSRIDRLDADAQITIKAAAVLGRSFDTDLLLSIHPLSVNLTALSPQLEVLRESGFLTWNPSDEEYVFHHALARDAAYNLLAFAQRKALHNKTANTLEEKYQGRTEQVNARLGYHFRMAGILDKASFHLAAAGETALDAYASVDAIELLTNALQLDEEFRGEAIGTDLARTNWYRMIGQAHYYQDQQSEAANWYRKAVEQAGVAPGFIVTSLLPTLLRGIFNPKSLGRPPAPNLTDKDIEMITHALVSMHELGTIYLWESAVGKFLMNTINMVRVARIVGPTRASANAVAVLAFVLSSVGLRKSSEKMVAQAVKMATEFADTSQIVGVQVVSGMVLAQNGSPLNALSLLKPADDASDELISGIWRHRSKYMYADALTWLGRYKEAYDLFIEAAKLSHGAEPHTVALAISMAALTQLRMGRPERAVELLEGPDGVPHALECGVPFAVIMSLGVLSEARLALGQREAAISAAKEAETVAAEQDDGTGYYSSLFSYSSILSVRLQTGSLGDGSDRETKTAVADDLKRVRKLTRVAALGEATYALWRGVAEAQRGKTGSAKRLLNKAIESSTKAHQPFELGRSLIELSKLCQGDEKRNQILQAIDVFERHDMPLELARARALLDQ